MVKVSIIVPVYNVEKYLEKCLDSLVNQTLEDIEIIVVNDGSPDNSQLIIDKFEEKYPSKLKKVIKENGGQGSARNEGLKLSTGEYVAYVDSDDYVALDMYEKMYRRAKANDSDIAISGHYIVSESGNIIKEETFRNNKKETSIQETKGILFDKMGVCNKIYKTSFLKGLDLEFRSKKWYEDFDFTVKVLLASSKISVIEEPLYYYLHREGSTMNNSNVVRNLEILEAMDEIIKDCKKNNTYNKYYLEIEYLAILHVYLPTIVRILNANAKKDLKNKCISQIEEYMKKNFKNFTKNEYILSTLSSKKKKIFDLLVHRHYNIVRILFKIKKIYLKLKK